MFKIILIVFLSVFNVNYSESGVIPVKIESNNKANLEFAVQLPNNDTIQIDLSFKLLTYSKNLTETKKEDEVDTSAATFIPPITTENTERGEGEIDTSVDTFIPSITTEKTAATTTTQKPQPEYVTVDEAIEAFRQDLIRKESEIAGIIESDRPFYRHFKLEFKDDINLTIRCTYDSSYIKRTLNISCYEYREYETERILSNGEVELVQIQDPNYKSSVNYIDARDMKQVYKMDIS